MNVLIIDDENRARNVISSILTEELDDNYTIFEASNLKDGVSTIKEKPLDIVFLDVEMPEHSGLEILDFLAPNEINFQLIFTTAYSQYALEAFKLSAVDYLLKPIDTDELKNALLKAKIVVNEQTITQKLQNLEKALNEISLDKIALEVPKGIIFVSYKDIMYFEADGSYTKVHLQDKKAVLIAKTLKHFATQLEDKSLFYKPHRSYLINLKFMSEIVKKDGLHVVMANKTTVPIARDRREQFLNMVKTVFS